MKTHELTRKIDEITTDFIAICKDLNQQQFNWKPNPQTWSIAQILDHLIVINNSYLPVIQQVREGRYKPPIMGKIGFMVNFFGKFILKSVQPDRRRKMKTFPIWEPSQTDIAPGILRRFENHQEELKTLIRSSEDLVKAGVVISSPANRNIVYRLDTAFEIIVTHEQRHLEQAKELLALIPNQIALP